MASGASKSAASILLIINIILYLIVISISGWAVNHAVERSRETASTLQVPARIFPIYFPVGNLATGFFIIISLLAGIVGLGTSFTGINNVVQGTEPELHTAAAYSLTTLSLTLLAMGFAFKEISLGWTRFNLRALEVIMIIVSGTQLLYTGTIYASIEDVFSRKNSVRGSV